MDQDEVLAAFDMLTEALEAVRVQLADELRTAMLEDRLTDARQILQKTERLKPLKEQLSQLRESYQRIMQEPSSRDLSVEEFPAKVHVEDEGFPEIEIAERLFGAKRGTRRRRQPVHKTPAEAYRIPILEALEKLGGRAEKEAVRRVVYEKMKNRFTADDLRRLPSNREYRWSNTMDWERYHLVREGLLRGDSPRGFWELTEAGRQYLEEWRRKHGIGQDYP